MLGADQTEPVVPRRAEDYKVDDERHHDPKERVDDRHRAKLDRGSVMDASFTGYINQGFQNQHNMCATSTIATMP